jgi:hypothetical protein
MRINPFVFGITVLAVFLGVILSFQAAGVWSVSGKTTSDGAVQPSVEDVSTIKGWMTLEQISTVYNVPLSEIVAQFSLPADTPVSAAIKDLESDTFSAEELRAWLESRMAPVESGAAGVPTPQDTPIPAALPTEHVAPEKTITGKTTFQDLLDWNVSEETIRQIIGGDLPAMTTLIKDYAVQNGLEFSTLKTALQSEVDKTR